jgi:uncharacterized protein YkwD
MMRRVMTWTGGLLCAGCLTRGGVPAILQPVGPPVETVSPAGASPSPLPTSSPGEPAEAIARDVLVLANRERESRGLMALTNDSPLTRAARYRSEDMVARDYFSHVDPDGMGPFQLLQKLGIPFQYAAENIAWNGEPARTAARRALENWMGSSGHRANLLDARQRRTGIGVSARPAGGWNITQLFTD